MKLKNLRPQDYASYTCQVSVRNVCGIPDKAITFRLTNTTGTGAAPPRTYLDPLPTLPPRSSSPASIPGFLSSLPECP